MTDPAAARRLDLVLFGAVATALAAIELAVVLVPRGPSGGANIGVGFAMLAVLAAAAATALGAVARRAEPRGSTWWFAILLGSAAFAGAAVLIVMLAVGIAEDR